MADWQTISALATAGGTLVLAGATFSAVRSSNRSARIAEQALLAGMRPLLVPSLSDAPSLFTALQEQTGLNLAAQSVPADVLVIDHAEMPSDN